RACAVASPASLPSPPASDLALARRRGAASSGPLPHAATASCASHGADVPGGAGARRAGGRTYTRPHAARRPGLRPHRPRARAPARGARADRLGELLLTPGARGGGLGADEHILRTLPR